MNKFVKFISAGLLINVPPEVVNQIYVHNKKLIGFIQTAIIYVVYMGFVFLFKKLIDRLIKNKLANALSCYIILGLFGLFIEWHLLGNSGATWYGQIAMFTFWGSFILIPIIFVEDPEFPTIKRSIVRYAIPWIILYLLAGIPNPGLGLIIWIFGCAWLNYFYIKYFRLLAKTRAVV